MRLIELFGLTRLAADTHALLKYMGNAELRARNNKILMDGAPDGLPLPSARLVYLVGGMCDIGQYYDGGVKNFRCIRDILKRNGHDIGSFKSVLDFGCGCGRVIRQWKGLNGPRVYGSDYNPRLVRWCRESLGFAKFSLNGLGTGLPYKDDKFDFIYTISVFTHLDERLQTFWINELKRVLMPGGLLYLTVHGESYKSRLSPEGLEKYKRGELVVAGKAYSGDNSCAVFHPAEYVRNNLAKGFDIVDFVPGDANDAYQDVYLLKKHP